MEESVLRAAGEALYGGQWRSPLSRDLGVTDRTVRNWIVGQHGEPSDLPSRLVSLLRARADRLSHVIALSERIQNSYRCGQKSFRLLRLITSTALGSGPGRGASTGNATGRT